jgi:two-component system, cell cycle response regulator DivK
MSSLTTAGAAPAPRPHVLLVEDSLDNREVYALYLEQSGYRVSEASLAGEAWEQLSHGPAPDVLVTDIVLPDIDGLELCRRLKADVRLHETPVIAITALPLNDHDIEKAKEAGSAAVLRKPCLPETLLDEIRRVLDRSADLQAQVTSVRHRAQVLTEKSRDLQDRSWALQIESMRITDRSQLEIQLRRVRSEYCEMPGLSLTIDQARRLWSVDANACQVWFDALVTEGFLRRLANGAYVLAAKR